MEHKTYYTLVENLNRKRIELSKDKSSDYATKDVLSNFKRLSQTAKVLNIDVITSYGYALFMVLLKLDRFNNLTRADRPPQNEPLMDTIMDAHNYLDLAFACYKEESCATQQEIEKTIQQETKKAIREHRKND